MFRSFFGSSDIDTIMAINEQYAPLFALMTSERPHDQEELFSQLALQVTEGDGRYPLLAAQIKLSDIIGKVKTILQRHLEPSDRIRGSAPALLTQLTRLSTIISTSPAYQDQVQRESDAERRSIAAGLEALRTRVETISNDISRQLERLSERVERVERRVASIDSRTVDLETQYRALSSRVTALGEYVHPHPMPATHFLPHFPTDDSRFDDGSNY
jgi:chromosome segregation ATPase